MVHGGRLKTVGGKQGVCKLLERHCTLLTTAATTFYLLQQLHSIYCGNYILSTTIRASLSLILFHIIYISYYNLFERIVWPISPQFEHFDGAFCLITLWSDVLLL
jgi:hypothetical protein